MASDDDRVPCMERRSGRVVPIHLRSLVNDTGRPQRYPAIKGRGGEVGGRGKSTATVSSVRSGAPVPSATRKPTWPTPTVLRLLRNDADKGRVYYNRTKPVPDRLPTSHSHLAVATTPIPDDELLAIELARLDRDINNADAEHRRLVDVYQAGLIDLPELQRRASDMAARQRDLHTTRVNLTDQRSALACGNRLRRRITDLAARVRQAINQLGNGQKQQLHRLLIEEVRVTGWHVRIHLRIPLDPPDQTRNTRRPTNRTNRRPIGE